MITKEEIAKAIYDELERQIYERGTMPDSETFITDGKAIFDVNIRGRNFSLLKVGEVIEKMVADEIDCYMSPIEHG